jgi:hypothetical protein
LGSLSSGVPLPVRGISAVYSQAATLPRNPSERSDAQRLSSHEAYNLRFFEKFSLF